MSNLQALPPPVPIGLGQDITGQVFGLLTAEHCVEHTEHGNRWLLRCECGRWAIRTVGGLNRSLRNGHEPMCSECLGELRSGLRTDRRAQAKPVFVAIMRKTGLLYSDATDRKHQQDILAECESVLGVTPEHQLDNAPTGAHGEALDIRQSPLMRILAPEGVYYECTHCGRPFRAGFGCLDCTEPVCGVCAGREEHPCWPGERTLEQIGAAVGVSRERARLILSKALDSFARTMLRVIDDEPLPPEVQATMEPNFHCGVRLSLTDDGISYCRRCGKTWAKGRVA